MSVLNIHLNPRISNYMVICKANSIFVAPRWLSALFLPITWTFRDKVVEFEHLHFLLFVSGSDKGSVFAQSNFIGIVKYWNSMVLSLSLKRKTVSCSWSICYSFQFRFPTVPVFTMVRGFKSHIHIWKSQDSKRTLCVCVCVHSRVKSMSIFPVYISVKKKYF